MFKTEKPTGLCVLKFPTFQHVREFNNFTTTYSHMVPVYELRRGTT